MTSAVREPIAQAVLELVQGATGIKAAYRRYRPPTEVDTAECPLLMQVQLPEKYDRPAVGVPPRRTMVFEISMFTADPQEMSVTPSTQLNTYVDAIERAMTPDSLTGLVNLGGSAYFARVDGEVAYFENLLGSGKSIAVLNISVMLP